jgi:hypothetical protein
MAPAESARLRHTFDTNRRAGRPPMLRHRPQRIEDMGIRKRVDRFAHRPKPAIANLVAC